MTRFRFIAMIVLAAALGLSLTWPRVTVSQEKTIKIGLIFDFSGPFSAAGSLLNYRGAKLAIDWANDKGGVLGKYKIVRVDADAQSKADVAINEAERLLNAEHVDILSGIYSSAHAVPIAERVDRQKKFLWITTAISDAVFKDRNLQYTFRPQAPGSSFGALSVQYIAAFSEERFKKAPKDLRIAIIYEDGPYGSSVAASSEAEAKRVGMQIIMKEGYSAQAADLSSLITKLRAARPDVLFHTGYNPDIALFLRQAKEQGLRVKTYVGHGAGHSQLDKLKETIGNESEGFHTVDPVASQLIEKKVSPKAAEMTREMVKRYQKEFGDGPIAPHVSMGFNNLGILLLDVLPRAIQKHGGFSSEQLAKAARETDIPEGGTSQGYGVKFLGEGNPMRGQNERAFPTVFQVIDGKFEVVWPKSVQTATPAVLLPASSPLFAR